MRVTRLDSLHPVTLEPQHSHQCTVCLRLFGEFEDSKCKDGHVYHLCNSGCEEVYQRVKDHLKETSNAPMG